MWNVVRSGAAASLLIGVLSVPIQATEEPEKAGNPVWTSHYNWYCSQVTMRCIRWTGDNEPTDDIVTGCNGIYLFHEPLSVVANCDQ